MGAPHSVSAVLFDSASGLTKPSTLERLVHAGYREVVALILAHDLGCWDGVVETGPQRMQVTGIVLMKSSLRSIPLCFMASPTWSSFLYTWAESTCLVNGHMSITRRICARSHLYPALNAVRHAAVQVSLFWNTPRPSLGIVCPAEGQKTLQK